jgi:hypothetical protein
MGSLDTDDPQKYKIFVSAGRSLLRAKGFPCSLAIQAMDKKIAILIYKFFLQLYFFNFWS